MPQPRAALDPHRGPGRDRRLPSGLQRRAAPQLARLSLSATLRRGTTFNNPKLQAGPPSRSVLPLGIANHNRSQHINPSQRLTLHLVQFSGPAQRLAAGSDLPGPRRRCSGVPPARSVVSTQHSQPEPTVLGGL